MRNREDWLCDQLDRDDLNAELRSKYEIELEDHAKRRDAADANRKRSEAVDAARKAEIRAMILANNEDFIQRLGQEEFGDDYELTQEGELHVVYSKVARDDQTHRRAHATLAEAQADLRYLFYNRMYDRYVRGGEIDALGQLVAS